MDRDTWNSKTFFFFFFSFILVLVIFFLPYIYIFFFFWRLKKFSDSVGGLSCCCRYHNGFVGWIYIISPRILSNFQFEHCVEGQLSLVMPEMPFQSRLCYSILFAELGIVSHLPRKLRSKCVISVCVDLLIPF